MTDPAFAPQPGAPVGSMRRAARNAVFVMIAETAAKVTTFAWTVVAARELTQGQFGSFNFALSVALILASIAEWGFDPLLIQRVAREPGRAEAFFAHAIGWEGALATALFGTAAIVGGLAADGTTRIVLLLVLLATYLDVYSDTIRAMGTAFQRQGVTSIALVLQRFATVGIAIPVLLLGGGLQGFAMAFLGGYVIGFVAHAVALGRLDVRFRFRHLERGGMRTFLRGTTAVGVSGLLLAALFRIDAIIITALKGDAALGAYSAAYRIFETSLFVVFAVNGALYPMMAERGDDADRVQSVFERAMGVTTLVYAPYAVVCLVDADRILDLLFGSQYAASSTDALRLLALAPFIYTLGFVGGSALLALQQTRILLVAAVAATGANLALNLALIPSWGIEGAAIATTMSFLVEGVILVVVLGRTSGRRPALVSAVLPGVVGGIGLAAVLELAPLSTIPALAVGTPVYLGCWWAAARVVAPWQFEMLGALRRTRVPDGD